MPPNALIESPDVAAALHYGWRQLPSILKECWPFIAASIVAAALFRAANPQGDRLATVLISIAYSLGIYVPVCVALCSRATASRIDWSRAFFAIILLATVIDCVWGILPKYTFHDPSYLKLLFSGSWIVAGWLTLKLSAAIPLFLLAREGITVREAFAQSWSFVRAEMWWRFWAIYFVATIAPAIVNGIFVFRVRINSGHLSPLSLGVALAIQTFFAVAEAWACASTVALVSTASLYRTTMV